MTKREASENLATALSECRDAGGPVEAVVVAIRQLEESTQDDPSEPEIKPGEWVYYGDKLPLDHCHVGKLYRTSFPDDAPYCIEGIGRFSYIERFYMPFDWERWPDVNRVIDFDDTSRITERSKEACWELDEEAPDGSRVIRILKRPEGK